MLTQPRPHRLTAWTGTLLVGLVAAPLAVALAIEPARTPPTSPVIQAPAEAAVLRGRVTDKAGAPLADARVRVAVPAANMLFADTGTSAPNPRPIPKLIETRTDAQGDYRFELSGINAATTASLDVLKPGYGRFSGTLMRGGDRRRIELQPGQELEFSITLEPARYYRGIVVDEQGKPIPAVEIHAQSVLDGGSYGVEVTTSGPNGTFELFNYPIELFRSETGPSEGLIHFMHPNYIGYALQNVEGIEPDNRKTLRIVLPTGSQVTGTVLDQTGKPVPQAMIDVVGPNNQKGTLTDAEGKFALRGLGKKPATLIARSLAIHQKANLAINLDRDQPDLEVRLQPMKLPANLRKFDVLGMSLTDETPELQSAYDLRQYRGVMIVDPGPNFDRLGIGQIAEGDVFWQVGNRGEVFHVREFVDQILAEATGPDFARSGVRVVYDFHRPEFTGNTPST